MVGVGKRLRANFPRVVPLQPLLVDEKTHQFGNGDGGVGIVELNRAEIGEPAPIGVDLFVTAQNVFQRTGDEKVLLFQPQLFSQVQFVVRIENLRDVFGDDLLLNRLKVVAAVELSENEFVGRFRRPQTQGVDGFSAVTDNRRIVRNADDFIGIEPVKRRFPVLNQLLDLAAEIDDDLVIRTLKFPRIAVAQPVVGKFNLPTVLDFLIENSVVVADAVTESRNFKRCQRIEETGCQPSQTAVSQTGVDLFLPQFFQRVTEGFKHGLHILFHLHIDDVVAHCASHQKLQ